MVPVDVAFSVTEEPWTLSAREMLPPLLAWRVTNPVAVMVFPVVIVMLPGLALSVREKVAPLNGAANVTAWESVTVTLPVVVAMRLGELMEIGPMAPEVEERVTVPEAPVAVTVPVD